MEEEKEINVEKTEFDSDEQIRKLIDESIDDIDVSIRKIGLKISNLLTSISEDKISKIWSKGRIILKEKLKKG
jgi:hypothetical protein